MNFDNKSRLLIGLITFLQTCKQIKIHRRWPDKIQKFEGFGSGRNWKGWVPKQFMAQGGAKFERESKTPLHAMIFWKVYLHVHHGVESQYLPVQCQQYKH